MWFGPSTAAGGIKVLCDAYFDSLSAGERDDEGMGGGEGMRGEGREGMGGGGERMGLGVVVCGEGVVYGNEVYDASWGKDPGAGSSEESGYGPSGPYAKRKSSSGRRKGGAGGRGGERRGWGDKAVLILVTTRLGIEGVNPVYYETVKVGYGFLCLCLCLSTALCASSLPFSLPRFLSCLFFAPFCALPRSFFSSSTLALHPPTFSCTYIYMRILLQT